jgi:hypothetical protein
MKISQFARDYVRKRTEDRMEDACKIWKPGEPTFDPVTKRASRAEAVVRYEGMCRIWEAQAGAQVLVGDEQVTMTSTYLTLPREAPVPESDDVIEITDALDPDMIGRTVTITGVSRGGDMAPSRRFMVEVMDSQKDTW